MRVLVVGTLPSAVDRTEAQLVAAGYDVVRCHEPGERPFPCAGLIDGRGCPLEADPVDVVVTARDRPWPTPSPHEDGAVCALRRHVPLVVTGSGASDPFERWTTREVCPGDDLAAACVDAARAPLRRHGEVATAAAREVVAQAGIDTGDVYAVVHRARGVLKVTLTLPGRAADVGGNVTARVLTALRELDPHAAGIDVDVTAGAEEAPPMISTE